jgi:hypothetical protein
MKISPPALIITLGTVMIVGAFALFGKSKAKTDGDEPKVPVPFTPKGLPAGEIGYKYRGLFIDVVPVGSEFEWRVYGTEDFSAAPIATGRVLPTGLSGNEQVALEAAMLWVDSTKTK